MSSKSDSGPGKQTTRTSALNAPKKNSKLSSSFQLYWFLGHAASIVCFVLWQVLGIFSRKRAQQFSRLTLLFQLVSYGIVIRQSVPISKTNNKLQLLRNENVQYFAFAAVLLVCSIQLSPWTQAVTPFIVYSFFHAITYFQKNLLDQMPMSIHTQAAISDRITYIASTYNLQALYFASLSELMLTTDIVLGLPRLLFSIFKHPLYVLFYGFRSLAVLVFLKLRYDESAYARQTAEQFDARISAFLNNPMVPPQLRDVYHGPLKAYVAKFAGMVLIPRIASQKKSQ